MIFVENIWPEYLHREPAQPKAKPKSGEGFQDILDQEMEKLSAVTQNRNAQPKEMQITSALPFYHKKGGITNAHSGSIRPLA